MNTTQQSEENMFIRYETVEAFYDGIAHLVQRGLTFVADGACLSIRLTGGF
jgi:hypothetical protein